MSAKTYDLVPSFVRIGEDSAHNVLAEVDVRHCVEGQAGHVDCHDQVLLI